jgi:hypothetical protein
MTSLVKDVMTTQVLWVERDTPEIAEDIRTGVLSTEGAANPGAFDVAVTEGVATLTGSLSTENHSTAAWGRAVASACGAR